MSQQSQVQEGRKNMAYGGQALIEGVMMRGRHKVAVAVRNPQGKIVVYEEDLNPTLYRGPISQIPFLRGLTGLWDALGIGLRALIWSAEVAAGMENPKFGGDTDSSLAMTSLSITAGMVFVSPAIASSGLSRLFGLRRGTAATMLEGVLRLGLVTGYIWLVGQTEQGKRLFSYHGAEHKTVNAVEAGAPLTPESVKRFPLEHPRCGTAFLLTTLMVSTVLQVVLGRPRFPMLILQRLLLVPIVAGIAYEFIKYSSQHMDDPTVRAIVAPNLLMQRLTTREPDLEMIEVAIAAMQRVLAADEHGEDQNIELPRPHSANGKSHRAPVADDAII